MVVSIAEGKFIASLALAAFIALVAIAILVVRHRRTIAAKADNALVSGLAGVVRVKRRLTGSGQTLAARVRERADRPAPTASEEEYRKPD